MQPWPRQTSHRGMRRRTRSCRARTSRLTLFEHVFDTARTSDGGNPSNKFAAECHEVECDVDRLGLGLNAKHATRGIELSLVHDDVLPHPALAASSRSFLAALAGATSQIQLFIDVCHPS